jgi:hypothetical protein
MGSENLHKVDAWNTQLQQDLVEQEEQIRITCEAEEAQRAQQEAEDKRIHREAKNKKLKLNLFDPKQHVKKWIEHRPATFALNKLNNLEYIELDYFTMRGCKEAMANTNKSVSHDTLTFMQQGDTFVIPPLAAIRPSKHIRNNEELSWEEMMDAKNMMLHFMVKSGLWQNKHTLSIVSFYVNLNCHPRKGQKNRKRALLLYQSCVWNEWFEALKHGKGFNIELIQDKLLCSLVEEVNDAIQDREFNQVQVFSSDPLEPEHLANRTPLPLLPKTNPFVTPTFLFFPAVLSCLLPGCSHHLLVFSLSPVFCHALNAHIHDLQMLLAFHLGPFCRCHVIPTLCQCTDNALTAPCQCTGNVPFPHFVPTHWQCPNCSMLMHQQ